MKITIVTGIFPPDAGGPATYVPHLAAEFVERGHDTTVTTLSDSLEHKDSTYPFPVYRILRQQPRLCRMAETIKKIAVSAKDSNIIYANGLFIESIIASFITRVPVVIKIVGDWAWEQSVGRKYLTDTIDEFQQKKYGWKVELIKLLRTMITRQADAVITPSYYLKQIVSGWGVKPEKLNIIYNAVDFTALNHLVAELPPYDGHTIVTVGRLVPWKGIDKLIKVVEKLPNIRLLVVRDGPQRSELEELANSIPLHNRVIFAGHIPQMEVEAYLRASDVFVLNSTYEGLPHIVLEAMKASTPVIATNVGGTSEVISHKVNGILIPPDSTVALQEAIIGLLNNKEQQLYFITEANKQLQTKFNWENLVERTEICLLSYARPTLIS